MFNSVLKGIMENENVELYEKKKFIKPNGSESVTWELKGKIPCNIQENQDFGQELIASETGDVVQAIYNLRTSAKIEEGQRIKRIEDDNLLYEIRRIYHAGKKTILEHYKAYLTRVDNQ